jgi:hypothetical protein
VSFALPEALFFTGIDWAAETHAVCVTDAAGKIVAEFVIEHSADGIATLIRRLARYGAAGGMPVAIERPDGRLVDLLLEAGHPVVPVKPNAIKAWRGALGRQVRRRRRRGDRRVPAAARAQAAGRGAILR